MGMLANMAARSEIKNRDRILAYVREFNPRAYVGPLLLPCHIITEVHNGVFAQTTNNEGVGFYRCQGYWWGRSISPAEFHGLRGPDSGWWLTKVTSAQPNPEMIAPISVGLAGFAAGIAEST